MGSSSFHGGTTTSDAQLSATATTLPRSSTQVVHSTEIERRLTATQPPRCLCASSPKPPKPQPTSQQPPRLPPPQEFTTHSATVSRPPPTTQPPPSQPRPTLWRHVSRTGRPRRMPSV